MATPGGGSGSNDLIEGLSERKKTLLEARIFGKPPSSLDGLSTGTRSASCSPAAAHRQAPGSQQQHQHQQMSGGGGGGGARGSSPIPPPAFSAQRSTGTEPTVLELTNSNSRSQQSSAVHHPLQQSASKEGLPPTYGGGKPPAAPQQQGATMQASPYSPAALAGKGASSTAAGGGRNLAVADAGSFAAPPAGATADVAATGAPPLPSSVPMARSRSETVASGGGVVGGFRGSAPLPQLPSSSSSSAASVASAPGAVGGGGAASAASSSAAAAAAAAGGGRKRPRSSSTTLSIEPSPPPPPAQQQKTGPSASPTGGDAFGGRPSSVSPVRLAGEGANGGSNKFRTIESYFTPAGGGGGGGGGSNSGSGSQRTQTDTGTSTAGGDGAGEDTVALRGRLAEMERQLQEMGAELGRARREKEEQEQVANGLRAELAHAKEEGQRLKEAAADKERRAAAALEDALRRLVSFQDKELREALGRNSHRLGRIVTSRTGMHGVAEIWEEGTALKELQKQAAELLQRKEDLDKRRRQIARESKKAQALATTSSTTLGGGGSMDSGASVGSTSSGTGGGVAGAGGGGASSASSVGGGGGDGTAEGAPFADELQLLEAEEGVRMHLGQLKKDEAAVQEARKALEREKSIYVRELRRVQHEDRSRFSRRPVLHGRYLLLSLLGRGGFSEVWRAFDLKEYCEAAVKIHQLNAGWTEEKKQNYMKHATREYAIHREMVHPRVVRLFDVFEIDSSSFATVLEYCKGTDLDYMIKTQKTIPERDARAILIQILAGLRYLNTPSGEGPARRQGIIHYDLKPGNILFDEQGDVKITDFGLSKIIDDSCEGASMELTSQGAGTYWYLPPECFVMGSSPPRISSKVDVWALGVIFYQMLFGSRPFGEGQSQEKVLHENTMLRATHVSFPAKPAVSPEAKDFIRACLTHSQADRPDVLKLCNHSYLRLKKLSS